MRDGRRFAQSLRALWFGILGQLGYRRVELQERMLDEGISDVTTLGDVTIEILGAEAADEYLAFRADADRDATLRQLAAGDRCFVARHRGRIAAVCWVATGRAWSVYLSREILLAADEAYVYDVFTSPELRGHRLYPALLAFIRRSLRAAGMRRMISFVVPENRPAMSDTTGYRTIGRIGYWRLGPWRYDFCRMRAGAEPPGGRRARAATN